jgi:hypothetical protein
MVAMSAKKYESNAEKQKAYRTRLKAEITPPTTDDPKEWNAYLKVIGLSTNRGTCLGGQKMEGLGLDVPDTTENWIDTVTKT